jgi:hypothetical protein
MPARERSMSARQFLDASSGHLSPETWAWLDEQTTDEAVRDPCNRSAEILGGRARHGWFIWASEAPIASVPTNLAAVMRYARKYGYDYVLLDCDALPMADLPVLHSDSQDQSIPPATS